MANNYQFEEKVVLVTGSNSGIGEGTAILFAKLGANVVITGRDKLKIQSVAQKCREVSKSDKNVLEVVADLLIKEDIKKLIDQTIAFYGKLDVLVNNAGIADITDIEESGVEDKYHCIMNTNVTALVLLCHYAVPYLKKTKGNIISVSSVASTKPHTTFFGYCMAKSAVDMLSKCLAIDLGKKGIRVNVVNPAVTRTNFFKACFDMDPQTTANTVFKECEDNYPLQRPGEPEDVANAIAFLASDKASFITGVTLEVDGGSMWTSKPVFDY